MKEDALEAAKKVEEGEYDSGMEAAIDTRRQQKMDQQLREMKDQGYDVCQLCGEQVPVYEDDTHEDVLRRLTEHANEEPDHVHHSLNGWMHVDDLPKTGVARIGHEVAQKSAALAIGTSAVLLGAYHFTNIDTFYITIGSAFLFAPLLLITFSGIVVSWLFDNNAEKIAGLEEVMSQDE